MFRATPSKISLTALDITPQRQIHNTSHDCIAPRCIRKGRKKTLRITISLREERAWVWCKKCGGKYDMFINKSHTAEQVRAWYKQWYFKIWEVKDLVKDELIFCKKGMVLQPRTETEREKEERVAKVAEEAEKRKEETRTWHEQQWKDEYGSD